MSEMGTIKIDGFKCERCGHVWAPRVYDRKNAPVICPRCKSPYWNKRKEVVK